MMKAMKKVIVILLVSSILLISVACSSKAGNKASYYADGILLKEEVIKEDGSWYNPDSISIPEKEGYTFIGWYWLKDGVLVEFTPNDAAHLTEDIRLYAQYSNELTVSYVTNTDQTIPTEVLYYNNTANKPVDPIKDGYQFIGWYKDRNFAEKFDFSEKIKENLTLYAKFVAEDAEFNVTFTVDGRSYAIYETKNKKIDLPADPKSEGVRFVGWYYEESYSRRFDATDLISEDTTLYAKFEPFIPEYGKLSTPTVTYDDGILRFYSDPGAIAFNWTLYRKYGEEWNLFDYGSTGTNTLNLTSDSRGTYKIRVIAEGDGVYTVNSDETIYEFNHLYLDQVSGFYFDYEKTALTFDPVRHADSYTVEYNGIQYDLKNKTTFDLPDKTIGSQELTFSITASDSNDDYGESITTYSFLYYRLAVPTYRLKDNQLVFNERTITYKVGSKTFVQTIQDGETLEPYKYSRKSYDYTSDNILDVYEIVLGWYLDAEYKIPYDYTEPITTDIVLYGKTGRVDNYNGTVRTDKRYVQINQLYQYGGKNVTNVGENIGRFKNYFVALDGGDYTLTVNPNTTSTASNVSFVLYQGSNGEKTILKSSFNTAQGYTKTISLESGSLYYLEFGSTINNTWKIQHDVETFSFNLNLSDLVIEINGKGYSFRYNKQSNFAYDLPTDVSSIQLKVKSVSTDHSKLESLYTDPIRLTLKDGVWSIDGLKVQILAPNNQTYTYTYSSLEGLIPVDERFGYTLTDIVYNGETYHLSNGEYITSDDKKFTDVLDTINQQSIQVEGIYESILLDPTLNIKYQYEDGSKTLYWEEDDSYTEAESVSKRVYFRDDTSTSIKTIQLTDHLEDLISDYYDKDKDVFVVEDDVATKVEICEIRIRLYIYNNPIVYSYFSAEKGTLDRVNDYLLEQTYRYAFERDYAYTKIDRIDVVFFYSEPAE